MSVDVPRVSVIVPNYNYARFLEARLRSILDQTYQNFEIIFLDDASRDESVALAREKFGTRIDRFEVNAVNSGNPFAQWNRGVRLARGEFAWIAEADDVCTPRFLERTVDALERSPRVGLAYCYTTPTDDAGNVIDSGFHHAYVAELDDKRWHADFVNSGRDEVRRYLSRKNTITNVSGVLFRREAYIGMGFAPEDMRMCGDWLAYCRLLLDWDIAFIAENMNFHRQHATKHTQNSVLDLTYFDEFLRVQQYLAQTFDLDASHRAAAFRRFMNEWDRLTVSNYGRLRVRNNLTLARMSAARYRRANERIRIAAHFLLNATKSLASAWKST